MYELVNFIVERFISEDHYEIMVIEDGDKVDIRVMVDKDYVSQVIGRGGKIAKSIRTIVKAASHKSDKNYSVYVEER